MRISLVRYALIFLLLLSGCIAAGPSKGKVERDYFDKDKLIIYDKNHNKTGEIRRDYFDKDKWIILDEDGEQVGTIERDYFDPDKWNYKKPGK